MDSIIIDKQNRGLIYRLCEFSLGQKWELQYRATRDGFSSKDFHSNCDGIENTLTIIKTTNEEIFGGFVEKAWDSESGYLEDPNAYIFSLVNKGDKPFKAVANDGTHAIYCGSDYGPVFGNGSEICIASNSNVNQRSRSYFGSAYLKESQSSNSILAGAYHFQTVEIEVFAATS